HNARDQAIQFQAAKLRREFARNNERQKILLCAPPTSQSEEGVSVHNESSLLFAVKWLSWGSFEAGASEAVGGVPSGPSSRPSMAVASPQLQVVRPRFAAGAPSGPAASPAARWQRSRNAQPCPGCRPRP